MRVRCGDYSATAPAAFNKLISQVFRLKRWKELPTLQKVPQAPGGRAGSGRPR